MKGRVVPPTNPFPEFATQRTRHEQRAYVLRTMVTLAKDGELYLTDCLAQPVPIRTLVGEVILGHAIDHHNQHVSGQYVPDELASYRIRLVSIPHMVQVDTEMPDGSTQSRMVEKKDVPISFHDGMEALDESMTYEAAKTTLPAFAHAQQFVKRWIHTEKTDITLPLRQAFRCLKQCGENVVSARARRLQRKYWKVREVRPEPPAVDEEPPRRGPGRPRKGAEVTA